MTGALPGTDRAAYAVAGATHKLSLNVVILTLPFAIGATLPLLGFALAGRQVADRVKAFRSRAPTVRRIGGVVMTGLAVALAFNATGALQRALPGYTNSLQNNVESSSALKPHLSGLSDAGNSQLPAAPTTRRTHTRCSTPRQQTGQLTIALSPGLQAYDLTFGQTCRPATCAAANSAAWPRVRGNPAGVATGRVSPGRLPYPARASRRTRWDCQVNGVTSVSCVTYVPR